MLFICISLTLKVFPWFSISRWFSSFFLPPAFFFEFFIDEIIKKTELGTLGAYSESEIYLIGQFIELNTYANERGVRIVPEFDSPGHTYAWNFAFPDLVRLFSFLPSFHPPFPSLSLTVPFICLSSLFPLLLSPFPPFPLSCSSITTQLPFPSPPSFLRSPLLYIHSLPLSSLLCSSPCSFLPNAPQEYSLFSFLSSLLHPPPLLPFCIDA